MENKKLNFLGLRQMCCYALSLVCFTFLGCSNELLLNEVNNATTGRVSTRTDVSDTIIVGGKQYEVLDYFSFITTIGCVNATFTSHLDIRISYPTVNPQGLMIYKESQDYYNYDFIGTNIYAWCNPIVSIVEDQLDIDDKICVPVDGSDTYLYLDITANGGPSTWGGEKEHIWIRYYFTYKDYKFKYLMLENNKDDPQHYKARLAVPFNSDDICGYIYLGDVRISDSNGNWGPMYLDY